MLAPLPYAKASKEYAAKFLALMGGMASHSSNILDSQSLWDATMADSISKALQQHKIWSFILTADFTANNRLGAIEHLAKYNSKARALVVTIKSMTGFPNFDSAKDSKQVIS